MGESHAALSVPFDCTIGTSDKQLSVSVRREPAHNFAVQGQGFRSANWFALSVCLFVSRILKKGKLRMNLHKKIDLGHGNMLTFWEGLDADLDLQQNLTFGHILTKTFF